MIWSDIGVGGVMVGLVGVGIWLLLLLLLLDVITVGTAIVVVINGIILDIGCGGMGIKPIGVVLGLIVWI